MNVTAAKTLVHGSALSMPPGLAGKPCAVLLRGNSGSGKSDVAFRLLDIGCGLISDDQVALEMRRAGQVSVLHACGVEAIAGLIEVRGVGLLRVTPAAAAPLSLVIDLVPRADVPRLPEWETVELAGRKIPRIRLHAFDGSTPQKILQAVRIVFKPDLMISASP